MSMMMMGTVHCMSISNIVRLPCHAKAHVKFSLARPILPIQALCGPFVPSKLLGASGAQGILPGVWRLQEARKETRRFTGGGGGKTRKNTVTAMAQLPGLFPNPEGWLVVAMELAIVYQGLSSGYNEAKGSKNLGYSKFANTGAEEVDKRTRIPSKWGMLLLYAPAALLGSILLAHRLGFISLTPVAELFGASGVAAALQSAVEFPDLRVLLVISALTIHFWKRVLEVRNLPNSLATHGLRYSSGSVMSSLSVNKVFH